MCLGAALWARVSRVVASGDRHDAEAAGLDDSAFHAELGDGVSPLALIHAPHGNGRAPFEACEGHASGIPYCAAWSSSCGSGTRLSTR